MRTRNGKHFLPKKATGVFFVLFLFYTAVNAQYNKEALKAAYIERITRFIEWPVQEGSAPHESFVIGVFGDTDFFYTLLSVFREKPIKEHKVTVIQVKRAEQIDTCNLCFISEEGSPMTRKMIESANSSGVLLISETTDFCKEGGHINFYQEDDMLKFEINERSIISAGFKVSYLLLQNTRIIK